MKKHKNEEGSVLLLVVLVIGVLSVLGTTVLSAALSNYKMGMASSDLKSNIYLTEAGFDEVYAEIYEIIGDATVDADQAADTQLATYTDDYFNEQVEKQIAHDLDSSLDPGDFIIFDSVTGEYIYDRDKIDDKLEEVSSDVFKTKFLENFKKIYFKNNNGHIKGAYKNLSISDEIVYIKKDSTAYLTNADLNFSDEDGNVNTSDTFTIYLASEYSGDTSRNAEVYLEIRIPEYGESYEVTSENMLITENPLWDKVIACDGNLTVLDDKTTVDGDIYVGTDVNIENGSNLTTSKNIAAVGDFKMIGNNTVITKDLYVRNILLDGDNVNLTVGDSTTSNSGIYIYDDLEMNGRKQIVQIDTNYYGFNDGASAASNEPDSSSGVIINSSDIDEASGSKITFNKDLYVYGTAYIGLSDDKKYQTGESISVKGNYIAYTMPLKYDGLYKNENMEFKYIKPLTLVKAKDGIQFYAKNRADYFEQYYKDYCGNGNSGTSLDNSRLNLKNINVIGNTYTLGTTINSSNVLARTSDENIKEGDFKHKNNIYNLYTKVLGNFDIAKMALAIPESIVDLDSITAQDFDFTGISIPEGELYTGSNIQLIVRNSTTPLDITLNSSPKYEFIITKGDVNISGDGVFNGCIITQGDVNVSGNCTLNYNKEVVLKCFGKHQEIAEAFKNHSEIEGNGKNGAAEKLSFLVSSNLVPPTGASSSTYTNLDYSSLLHFHNWKITYN